MRPGPLPSPLAQKRWGSLIDFNSHGVFKSRLPSFDAGRISVRGKCMPRQTLKRSTFLSGRLLKYPELRHDRGRATGKSQVDETDNGVNMSDMLNSAIWLYCKYIALSMRAKRPDRRTSASKIEKAHHVLRRRVSMGAHLITIAGPLRWTEPPNSDFSTYPRGDIPVLPRRKSIQLSSPRLSRLQYVRHS